MGFCWNMLYVFILTNKNSTPSLPLLEKCLIHRHSPLTPGPYSRCNIVSLPDTFFLSLNSSDRERQENIARELEEQTFQKGEM